jgi:hypothetical protein
LPTPPLPGGREQTEQAALQQIPLCRMDKR